MHSQTATICAKILELAAALGHGVRLRRLDSAAIVQLIVWIEDEYHIAIADDEITMDCVGTINRINVFIELKTA